MTLPDLGSDLISVAVRTAIVYVCLVIGFRLAGSREAGQLSTLDLVVLLVIANAVQNAMVGENVSLIGGLLAAAVILGLDRGLHALMGRSRRVQQVLEGDPVVLVEDGRILEETLDKEGISRRELGIALRQNGLLEADEARFVFLETNGQLSVIPRRDERDGDDGPDGPGGSSGPRRPGRLSGADSGD